MQDKDRFVCKKKSWGKTSAFVGWEGTVFSRSKK